jgi:hypothetical protein
MTRQDKTRGGPLYHIPFEQSGRERSFPGTLKSAYDFINIAMVTYRHKDVQPNAATVPLPAQFP